MPSLAPRERLGPYEILSPLGSGGMGEVWKARDTRLDRIVALKVSKREFTERFERKHFQNAESADVFGQRRKPWKMFRNGP